MPGTSSPPANVPLTYSCRITPPPPGMNGGTNGIELAVDNQGSAAENVPELEVYIEDSSTTTEDGPYYFPMGEVVGGSSSQDFTLAVPTGYPDAAFTMTGCSAQPGRPSF